MTHMHFSGIARLTVGTSVLLGLAATSLADEPKQKSNEATVQALMTQLRSSDGAQRREAAAKLEALPEAIPALRKAVDSSDFNAHWYAKPVLRELLLRKARHVVENNSIDLFLERLLR